MTQTPIQMTLATDCALLSDAEVTKRILRVTVAAAEAPHNPNRLPVNLALVIDRSGSMQGEKLVYAKQAAAHVLNLLGERDQAAIVIFDDNVETVSVSRPMTLENRHTMQQAISRLNTGGSTALFAGWMQGAEQAAHALLETGVNRVLLFTDGQANCGETDPHVLAHHAAALRKRGLSTSTFGVGIDYNHNLLEGIAAKGGGQYHFIETPQQIPDLFTRELNEILSIQARRVHIHVNAPLGVSMKLLGSLTHESVPGRISIPLGDLCAGRSIEYYVELLTPAHAPGSDVPIEVAAEWTNEDNRGQTAIQNLRYAYAAHAQAKAAPRDYTVRREAAMVRIADIEANALKMGDEGKGEAASQLLLEALAKYGKYLEASRVSDLRALTERLKNKMVFAIEQKQRHYDASQRRERRMKS